MQVDPKFLRNQRSAKKNNPKKSKRALARAAIRQAPRKTDW